jgi:ABC-type Zn2+ transport system substrate-binding protein/surface adhesin
MTEYDPTGSVAMTKRGVTDAASSHEHSLNHELGQYLWLYTYLSQILATYVHQKIAINVCF